jgi:prolyl-tRNA synthetase
LIIPLEVTDGPIMDKARELYKSLGDQGVKVLMDDRDERAGVKFKDADLIGIPIHLVLGKEFLKSGNLELKFRRSGEKFSAPEEEALNKVKAALNGE